MTQAEVQTNWDVVVIGSGAAAMMSALRAADNGLTVAMIEKAHFFGGTSATSGGVIWVPCHGLHGFQDSREQALTYLRHVSHGMAPEGRLEAYVDYSPRMVAYLQELKIDFNLSGIPDYLPNIPGASVGRSLTPRTLDGKDLGDGFFLLREPLLKILDRYSPNMAVVEALTKRSRGWALVAAKMFLRYWLDIPWRMKTRRDRSMELGNALVGALYREVQRRNIPVLLNTRLRRLVADGASVCGVEVETHGTRRVVNARKAVILAAGGFEQSQKLRDDNLPIPTESNWSLTPRGANTGDALEAARKIGAATEFMSNFWWSPTMQLPAESAPNINVTHQMFFDHRHPHSLVVNRLGERFVNEGWSYDEFGKAMIEDHKRTGANAPCWMIFDANYRAKYGCGAIMSSIIMPDSKIPQGWWDNYIYRAPTVSELSRKILVPEEALNKSVARINYFAKTGKDEQFQRGEDSFDRFFGDDRMKPNPCLGPVDKAPYYAIRIDLGDLGTKGGLKVDANARVLDANDRPFDNLYAVGNCSASPFADAYPGAGGTLGPAMTFGYIAADHIARSNR